MMHLHHHQQKRSSGLLDLYSEDEEDIEVTGDDGDDFGDEDVEYFASFSKNKEARRLKIKGVQRKSASVILSAWSQATVLFDSEASYSFLNSARSAILGVLVDEKTSI
ncbi:hypothetical protein ElyMa_002286000, partial [Elysia marginata]